MCPEFSVNSKVVSPSSVQVNEQDDLFDEVKRDLSDNSVSSDRTGLSLIGRTRLNYLEISLIISLSLVLFLNRPGHQLPL
jgi:hypothetical protein